MKHVLYGDKSLLMGDDIADALSVYAALLIDSSHADSVSVHAIGPDGSVAVVTLLLASGVSLAVETTNSDLESPDNSEIVSQLAARIEQLRHPPEVQPEDPPPAASEDDQQPWE